MKRAILIFVSTILMSAFLSAHDDADKPYVLLPANQTKAVSHLCSRRGPEKIEGSWQPDEAVLKQAEENLSQLKLFAGYSQSPKKYYRQYIAVVIGGKKMLYLNAACANVLGVKWKTEMISVCDGGPCLWGALYDTETQKYSELHFNGRA